MCVRILYHTLCSYIPIVYCVLEKMNRNTIDINQSLRLIMCYCCDNILHVLHIQQADFAASLFTGMSVSGEKSTRPRARKPVQPVKKPVKQEHHQPTSSYEDLLGLVSVRAISQFPRLKINIYYDY